MKILNVYPEIKNEKMTEGKAETANCPNFFAIQCTPTSTSTLPPVHHDEPLMLKRAYVNEKKKRHNTERCHALSIRHNAEIKAILRAFKELAYKQQNIHRQ